MWGFVQRLPAAWVSSGMGPARLDRAEARLRFAGEDLADWAVTELMDAAEGAAMVAMGKKPKGVAEAGEGG